MGFLPNLGQITSAFNPKGKSKFPDPFTQSVTGIGAGGGGGSKPATPTGPGLPYWFNYGSKDTQYPGVDSLMQLLQNPGQTDTLMLNRALLANSRGTQGQQDAARGSLASKGFGSSGVGQALQAAIGQAGQNRESDIYANEARRREELKRSDLGFLYDFIVGPEVSTYGANKGVSIADSQRKSQNTGAAVGAGAGLLAALIPLFACRTAEELYGAEAEETRLARFYMGVMADPETRAAYGTGSELAERVRHDPKLRAEVKPIFDTFVAEARRALAA